MTAERSGLQIRLLGPVQAIRDGTELALGSAHRRAVFAALAGSANHALSREELLNAVWGDNAPASAMGNLYTYVSTLRNVLDPDRGRWSAGRVLTSGGGSYCLHVDDDDVDLVRFESRREEGRRLRATGDAAGELAAVADALALWRGEAFAGVPGPYAERQRLRLGELYLATVERRAEILIDLDRPGEALDTLMPLLPAQPRREHLHGLAMTALARTGRRDAARELYRDLEGRLVEQSGTEPGAALRKLNAALLDRPAPAEPPPPDLIGRDDEVRVLRAAVADVAAGRGGSVWIDGEPGSGKSALIDAAIRDATRLGCRVGTGVGDELAQRMPLSVLFECVDSIDEPDGADTGARTLAGALRSAAELIANPATAVLETTRSLVRAMCAEQPLILVIDDLHWADETSLTVWHALHRLAPRLPLLLIGAARPLPASRELHLIRSVLPAGGTRVLELAPLREDDAVAVVRAAQLHEFDADDLADVVTAAAGNPYYLRRLATAWIGGGILPPSVVAAVQEHLSILPDETHHLLRAIAFLGGRCTVDDLPAVTGRPVPDLLRTIEEAVRGGLLVESGRSLDFRHPIVRRVVYDAIPTALRVMVHREFAEKIATVDGRPERVVAQLTAGPVPVDTWVGEWLIENAETICARMPEAAIEVLRHATAQAALPPQVREPLTAHLARVLFRRGLPAEAEAGWVAARTGDADLRAEMRWMIAILHHRRGQDAAALDIMRAEMRADAIPSRWTDRYRRLIGDLDAEDAMASGTRRR
jgi:DNA-binding SARP family transcriptional activator